MIDPMRVGNGFTLYGGPVDKQNPSGLMYLDPGDIIDAAGLDPVARVGMFLSGELVRVPFID